MKAVALQRIFHYAFCFIAVIAAAAAFYDDAESVTTFATKTEFADKVLKSSSVWIIQFYNSPAAKCKKCQNIAPIYKKLAATFKGIVDVGAIDSTSSKEGFQQRLAAKYGIADDDVPTLLIFGNDKENPAKYDGNILDFESLIRAVMELGVVSTIQARVNDVSSSGRSSSSTGEKGKPATTSSASKVVRLHASDFDETVLNSTQVSMVAFIAPWCGHCKALFPEWEIAARKLEGTGAFLGLVDATVETELASQYGVKGYPTIKVFPGGKNKSKKTATDYQGGRQADQIVQYALMEVDRTGVPLEIPQLTDSSVVTTNCQGPNKICVLVALPHILDSGAEGRNRYKEIMSASAKAVRGNSFRFIWFEGSSQPDLENAMELTFGFPAVAALSLDKGVYAVMRGSFSENNVQKFLLGITAGKTRTFKLERTFEIQEVDPWDGLDGVPLEEEPLEDIMNWDDTDEL